MSGKDNKKEGNQSNDPKSKEVTPSRPKEQPSDFSEFSGKK